METIDTKKIGLLFFDTTLKLNESSYKDLDKKGEDVISKKILNSDNFLYELAVLNMFCVFKSFKTRYFNNEFGVSEDIFNKVVDEMITAFISSLISKESDFEATYLKKKDFIIKRFTEYEDIMDCYRLKKDDPIMLFNKIAKNLTNQEHNNLDLVTNLIIEITHNIVNICPKIDFKIVL